MDPIVTIEHLVHRFGDLVAVNDLSLDVYPGEVFGLLGHNGAGKTTTVRLLNGLLRPQSGTLRVKGYDPLTEGAQLRRHTGVLTETPALEERLTARENLTFYGHLFGLPRTDLPIRVGALLTLFSLTDRADEKVRHYSKGMKQRLALARSLLHDPELIFLDEPTAGLDPVAAYEVRTMIKNWSMSKERTTFLCTHNLSEAQQLCDRVGVLERGRLKVLGTPGELARDQGHHRRITLTVAPEDTGRAREILTPLTQIDEDPRQADALILHVTERDRIPELTAMLVEAGIRIYSIVPDKPTLEDIYLALYAEEEVPNE